MAANHSLLSSDSDFLNPPPWVYEKTAEFVDGLERKFRVLDYPPTRFIKVESMYILSEQQIRHSSVRLEGMHNDSEQSTASCIQLLQTTMDALPTKMLKLLLGLSIWKKIRHDRTIRALEG